MTHLNKTYRNYIFFALQLLRPKGKYNGQKLTKLVITKTAAKISKIIPKIPVTTLVKYKITKIAANKILIILSVDPMFFFII